jgi:Capsule polysaccharide biosynthesis protein
VMVASLRAWTTHNVYESVFAQALRLRGAEVGLLTCGGGQPQCELGNARGGWPQPCDRCGWYTDRVAGAARLPSYRLADRFAWGEDARRAPLVPPPSPAGIDPRRASEISLAWMLKSTEVDADSAGATVERDFAVAAAGVASAAERVLDEFRPETLLLLNGLFAAERVIREVALAREIEVVTYEMAPRERALVFSSGTPAPLYDTDAAWEDARDRQLAPAERSEIESMLTARSEGRAAHESYFDDPLADPERLRASLDLPPRTRVISLFTNLAWDSAVVGRDLAYPSMLDWIAHAVEVAGELDDAVLVIRVHPAEERWGTMQPVEASLPELPPSVRVIGPDQALSSYALLEISDLALTYTTTVGLEAAARGVPVAVAALTHYRGRGFTHDLGSPEDLASLLRSGEWAISDEQVELALRYAFMFFYRCMIPFALVEPEFGKPASAPDDTAALRPGGDPWLDFICDRILDGGDFTLPDELALPAGVSA